MKEILRTLTEKVQPKDVIYFLIFIGQLAIIIFQEMSFRRKDTLFEGIMGRMSKEINRLGNQLTAIAGIVHFLAFNRNMEKGVEIAESEIQDQDGSGAQKN